MKKFITAISLQGRDLKKNVYMPIKDAPKYEKPTSFPIMASINASVSADEEIEVYAIVIGGDSDAAAQNRNYEIFEEELSALSKEKGFRYTIKKIDKDENDDADALTSLFCRIIGLSEDGDELSACITYGTKPISVVTIMALHYAYRVHKNVDVKNIVYGRMLWNEGADHSAEIFDVSPLFYIDCATENLAKLNLKNPEEALRLMLGLGD